MPTSADGILTCTFDPARTAVQIRVDGDAWPAGSNVSRVTITRAPSGQGAIPVRDLERRAASGGTLLGSDNEAPLDTSVTYRVTGYDTSGDEVRIGERNDLLDPRLTTGTMTLNGATVTDTRPGTGALDGKSHFRRTITSPNTASPMSLPLSGLGTAGRPVVSGKTYVGSWYARKTAGGPATRMDIGWYDAAGVAIGSAITGASNSVGTGWTRFQLTAVAPAGAAFVRILLVWTGTAVAAQTLDLAMAQWEPGTVPTPYKDGTYPGVEWLGPANGSMSLLPTPNSSLVTLSTAGAAWGLWIKIPGRADMVTRVGLVDAGEFSRATLGGSWQVPGGVAIAQAAAASLAQSAGLGSLGTTLQIATADPGQAAALWRIMAEAPGQVVLMQTGQPEELPSGYYQVVNPSQASDRTRSNVYGRRLFTLPITESVVPAGSGTSLFGATHDDIAQSFASHTEIAATVGSHLELAEGAWS